MEKQVYLFELDSVRKTDEEIIAGQNALYDEVVLNGNIVVLTYNQLIDSRGFFSLLTEEGYQEGLIELFKQGRIRISQYGDVRSIAQYLINTIQPDKKFIYSALPVKCSQKHLLALIKRSLIYSDLSEMHSYMDGDGDESDKGLKELFVEVENGVVKKSSLLEEMDEESALRKMRSILERLSGLVATILQLGTLDDIYVRPRLISEYDDLKMHDLIRCALKLEYEDTLWKSAVSIIRSLDSYRDNCDNRSVYLRELKERCHDFTEAGGISAFQYAEAIINLCYNYACEISICNISKHYNVDELRGNDMPTFGDDFRKRLEQDWHGGINADKRYLTDEEICCSEFNDIRHKIPDVVSAARYLGKVENTESGDDICRYEYNLESERKSQRREMILKIFRELMFTFFYVCLACGLEDLANRVQDSFDVLDKIIPHFISFFLSILAVEIITGLISRKFIRHDIPSLSESLNNLIALFKDGKDIIFREPTSYWNDSGDIESRECRNEASAIEYVVPREIKNYIRYRNDDRNKSLFVESDIYSLVDVNDYITRRRMVMDEELFGHRYGIVYDSPYNLMIVDPIKSGGGLRPYERVVPAVGGGGVVIVTEHKGNFVLLRQFRHAPRKEQYCFPRGFSEPGMSGIDNGCRELEEELDDVVLKSKMKLLGSINSDSGLTSGTASVYLAELERYSRREDTYEGIEDILEIPVDEMDRYIEENSLDDGFTLGAYALYKAAKSQSRRRRFGYRRYRRSRLHRKQLRVPHA